VVVFVLLYLVLCFAYLLCKAIAVMLLFTRELRIGGRRNRYGTAQYMGNGPGEREGMTGKGASAVD